MREYAKEKIESLDLSQLNWRSFWMSMIAVFVMAAVHMSGYALSVKFTNPIERINTTVAAVLK